MPKYFAKEKALIARRERASRSGNDRAFYAAEQALDNYTRRELARMYKRSQSRHAKKANSRKMKNPKGVSISGWVKAKAVKIVRNKRGQAVSVKIKT